jgi:hypothetical protein
VKFLEILYDGCKNGDLEKAAAEEKERQRKAASEEGAKKKPLATGKLTHVFLTHNWSNDEIHALCSCLYYKDLSR